MARRGRRNDTQDLEREDDFFTSLAAPVTPAPLLSPGPTFSTPRFEEPFFSAIEDRRTYHPLAELRPPLTTGAVPATRQVNHRPVGRFPSQEIFNAPERVLVCVRRKTRREVIFAKRKRRKGAGARRRRRNWLSNVRC